MGTNIRTEEFKKNNEHKSEKREGHEDTISRKSLLEGIEEQYQRNECGQESLKFQKNAKT